MTASIKYQLGLVMQDWAMLQDSGIMKSIMIQPDRILISKELNWTKSINTRRTYHPLPVFINVILRIHNAGIALGTCPWTWSNLVSLVCRFRSISIDSNRTSQFVGLRTLDFYSKDTRQLWARNLNLIRIWTVTVRFQCNECRTNIQYCSK